jgi:hypothetical protein
MYRHCLAEEVGAFARSSEARSASRFPLTLSRLTEHASPIER